MTHGALLTRSFSSRFGRMVSAATNMMLSAITASTGACGICAQPSAATANVMLWATVKAVMTFTSIQVLRTSKSSASTNSKWSMPSRMCSTPSRK